MWLLGVAWVPLPPLEIRLGRDAGSTGDGVSSEGMHTEEEQQRGSWGGGEGVEGCGVEGANCFALKK